jgi:hypothetical protein
MLPSVALSTLSPVHVSVGGSVGVPVKIVVVIDIYVAAVPITITPMSTPSAPSGGAQRNPRTPR